MYSSSFIVNELVLWTSSQWCFTRHLWNRQGLSKERITLLPRLWYPLWNVFYFCLPWWNYWLVLFLSMRSSISIIIMASFSTILIDIKYYFSTKSKELVDLCPWSSPTTWLFPCDYWLYFRYKETLFVKTNSAGRLLSTQVFSLSTTERIWEYHQEQDPNLSHQPVGPLLLCSSSLWPLLSSNRERRSLVLWLLIYVYSESNRVRMDGCIFYCWSIDSF